MGRRSERKRAKVGIKAKPPAAVEAMPKRAAMAGPAEASQPETPTLPARTAKGWVRAHRLQLAIGLSLALVALAGWMIARGLVGNNDTGKAAPDQGSFLAGLRLDQETGPQKRRAMESEPQGRRRII